MKMYMGVTMYELYVIMSVHMRELMGRSRCECG